MAIAHSFTNCYQRWYDTVLTRLSQRPVVYILLFVFFLGGSWLRFYHLRDTLMFQGDQGRDAIVVSDIFRRLDPVFIGPVTSVGNMYLGPFYYYFMLPFLWLSYPSPLGPAIGVALVNSVTILLVYRLGSRLVGSRAALWASFFFAFSQIAITYSRFSWNPNLSALFALLVLYYTHRAYTVPKSWLWVGLCAGLLIQLHYVNLILLAVSLIFWLRQLYLHRQDRQWFVAQHFWRWTVIGLSVFVLTAVPLLLFDWKHDFLNARAAVSIFSQESSFSDQQFSFLTSIIFFCQSIPGRLGHLFSTLFLPNFDYYWWRVGFGLFCIAAFAYYSYRHRHSRLAAGYMLLTLTALISVTALALYRHSVFDHYILFFLPVNFLMIGTLLADWQGKLRSCALLVSSLAVVLAYFVGNYRPGFYTPPGQTYSQTQAVAEFVNSITDSHEKYTFILFGANRDLLGDHYRFFFDNLSNNRILPLSSFLDSDVFYVIDETRSIDITHTDRYEIKEYLKQNDATYSSIATPENFPRLYRLYPQLDKELL